MDSQGYDDLLAMEGKRVRVRCRFKCMVRGARALVRDVDVWNSPTGEWVRVRDHVHLYRRRFWKGLKKGQQIEFTGRISTYTTHKNRTRRVNFRGIEGVKRTE